MCFHPVTYGTHVFPCGKCLECNQRIRENWSLRLAIDLYYSIISGEKSFFTSLTYDDEHVPKSKNNFNTLSKRDVQLFFKRLRKLVDIRQMANNGLRYFLSGEYGPTTHRPHYHLIIFGFNSDVNIEEVNKVIKFAWKNGFTQDIEDDLVIEQVHYCSQYLCKPEVIPDSSCVRQFRMMSKHIGSSYLCDYNINWHYGIFSKEYVSKVCCDSPLIYHYLTTYDKKRNVHDGYELFNQLIHYFIVQDKDFKFDINYYLKKYLTDDEILICMVLRDYMPSNILPFIDKKPIPRYLRERIFPYEVRVLLNIYYLVNKWFNFRCDLDSSNLSYDDYLNLLDDNKKIKEKKTKAYYKKVCEKKNKL